MQILTLGEKIKRKRKEMGLTLKELAGDRITPGQISLVESGKSNPSIDLLEYIAHKLDTDIDYFLESEEKQAIKFCEYFVTVSESLLKLGNTAKVQEIINKGMTFSTQYNLVFYRGRFDFLYAQIKYKNKEYQDSQQYALSANSAFLKTDSIDDAAESFLLLGKITYNMGYVSTALNYFTQADLLLSEYNHINEFIKAKICFNIAQCYYQLLNYEEAIKFAGYARDKLELVSNKKEYGESLINLSIHFLENHRINDALRYARDSKKIFDEISSIHDIANIETNLGVIFSKGNDMDESFEHLEKAYKLQLELKDKASVETLFKMCDNYIVINKLVKAESVVNSIIKYLSENLELPEFNVSNRIRCYEYLYKIFSKEESNEKAEQILLEGLGYIEGVGTKKQMADFYVIVGKFYTNINQKEHALKYLDRGFDLYRELNII